MKTLLRHQLNREQAISVAFILTQIVYFMSNRSDVEGCVGNHGLDAQLSQSTFVHLLIITYNIQLLLEAPKINFESKKMIKTLLHEITCKNSYSSSSILVFLSCREHEGINKAATRTLRRTKLF
jgi:hypothetical protein